MPADPGDTDPAVGDRAARVVDLPLPPTLPEPRARSTAAVLGPLLASGTGVVLALATGSVSYVALAVGLGLGTAATVWATARATRRHDAARADRARAAYLRAVRAALGSAVRDGARMRAQLERRHPAVAILCQRVEPSQRSLTSVSPQIRSLRVGTATVAAPTRLRLPDWQGGHAHADPDPASLATAHEAVRASRDVGASPLVVPLPASGVLLLVGPAAPVREVARAYVCRLALTHPPGQLSIAVRDESPGWDWLASMPHLGSPGARRVDVVDLHASPHPVVVADDRLLLVLAPPGAGHEPPADVRVELGEDGTATVDQAGRGQAGSRSEGVVVERLSAADARVVVTTLVTAYGGTAGSAEPQPPTLADLLALVPDLPPLAVPLGVGADGRPIVLDLREAADGGHGPHGLVVGATGSGKSELLRSVVGALLRPGTDVPALLLVDFKGGAAFDAFGGHPRLAGLVTNLTDDPALLPRVAEALEGELDHRQRLDRTRRVVAARATGADRPGAAPPPAPAPLVPLVVVVDELAELLDAWPDLLPTLVRVGRLGRSLRVHLLVASQRLDEGRLRGLEGHLRYRVALRTYTAADSTAVLGTPAAHALPSAPGHGLLAVDGEPRPFRGALLGGWAPSSAAGARPADPVWSPPLPTAATRERARLLTGAGARVAVVGLTDDVRGRQTRPLVLDLLGADGHPGQQHAAVVGAAGSGRSTALRTLAAAWVEGRSPARAQVLAVEAGGCGLAGLAGSPYCSTVVGTHDGVALERVLGYLEEVLAERAAALSAAGLPDLAFLEARVPDEADRLLPDPLRARVLVLVDGVDRLRRERTDEEGRLVRLAADGPRLGLHLAVSAARWADVRPALLDLAGWRLELRLADPVDSAHGAARARTVPRRPGRGLAADGAAALVATTAALPEPPPGDRWSAPPVRPLPLQVPEPPRPASARFAVGVREHRFEPVEVDIGARPDGPHDGHLLVLGAPGSGRTTLLARVVAHVTGTGRSTVHLVDPTGDLAARVDDRGIRRHDPGADPGGVAYALRSSGPAVLVVDDMDRVPSALVDTVASVLADARRLSLALVAARSVAGATRMAYEPGGAVLRALGAAVLVLSGDPAEGPVADGVTPRRLPPGRGTLVRPGQPPVLVQAYLSGARS